MTPTEPDLALELQMTRSEMRALLNGKSSDADQSQTYSQELTDAQIEYLRHERARPEVLDRILWVLEPGDTVKRRDLHAVYGGQRQGGIATPVSHDSIMIFTNPEAGARFGYDDFEGLREDGSYAYTGEGQRGDQTLRSGNKAIFDAERAGKSIRLFRTAGVYATYVGSFVLGQPPYFNETIPDVDGLPRTGIIFNLVPADADLTLLPAYGEIGELAAGERSLSIGAWHRPEYSDLAVPGFELNSVGDRVVTRAEFELQAAFGDWLLRRGNVPRKLRIPTGAVVVEPDFYVEELGWIVEAKRSAARWFVRLAIGQVLDYVSGARRGGLVVSPVILLPGLPEEDLADLMLGLGIKLIVPHGTGFREVSPPS